MTFSGSRGNEVWWEGWEAVWFALKGCGRLLSLDNLDYGGLVGGSLRSLGLSEYEEGMQPVALEYLPRSASTLTRVDMRWVRAKV